MPIVNEYKKNNICTRSYADATSPLPGSPTIPSTLTGPSRMPSSSLKMGGNPKPVNQSDFNLGEWDKLVPGILNDAGDFTNDQILDNLKKAATIMQRKSGIDYWITDDG